MSHPYLPIGRILVLLDANPEHRRMVEFIRDQAWLRDLAPDIAVFAPAGASDEKLIWARDVLEASPIELRRLEANCPHEAVEHYRRDHRVDLVVLSREVALSEGGALCGADVDDLWSRRTPVLVC